jgi:hypothetical protein
MQTGRPSSPTSVRYRQGAAAFLEGQIASGPGVLWLDRGPGVLWLNRRGDQALVLTGGGEEREQPESKEGRRWSATVTRSGGGAGRPAVRQRGLA